MGDADSSDTSATDAESSSDEVVTDTDDARSEVSFGDDLYIRRLKLRTAEYGTLFLLQCRRQMAMLRLRELRQGSVAKSSETHSPVLLMQDVDETLR